LLVGGAAYAAGRSRSRGQDDYQEQDDQYYEQQAPPPPVPQAAPSPAVDYGELEQLGKLHAAGTLTDEEFAAAKAKILGT
jgi:hypothetical protein